MKRYDEALGVLKAISESPTASSSATAAVLNNMGVLILRRGATPLTASAAYYLTKATDADADPDYMFNLGYAYASDRNYQGALYWLREALRRMGRADLIGNGKMQLVPSYQPAGTGGAEEGKRGGSVNRPFKTQHTGLPKVPARLPGRKPR